MAKCNLKRLWAPFERGDHLSNNEVQILIKSAEEGLGYLRARGERLAASRTSMDLELLKDYLFWRGHGQKT